MRIATEKKGFAALVTVLIMSVILLGLFVTSGIEILLAHVDSAQQFDTAQARILARGCIDSAATMIARSTDMNAYSLATTSFIIDATHMCTVSISSGVESRVDVSVQEGSSVQYVSAYVSHDPIDVVLIK